MTLQHIHNQIRNKRHNRFHDLMTKNHLTATKKTNLKQTHQERKRIIHSAKERILAKIRQTQLNKREQEKQQTQQQYIKKYKSYINTSKTQDKETETHT